MKKQYFTVCYLILFGYASVFSQQILSVTPSNQAPYDDMKKLIRDHLTGAGVEILNVESNIDPRSIGYFTDGGTAIGLNRGLIMTTGFAEFSAESGNFFANSSNLGGSVQAQLQAIATDVLNDVSFFKITFRPFSDSIQFKYVFASEEYPEYACSPFNDVFGFFLNGPNPIGGNYTDLNIALIPGTNLPVSINTIHPNNPAQAPCPPLNEQFYHDNGGTLFQPAYDGFTDIFTAEASVVPCATYEMVIAIADVGDAAYDSGVFLEAKSLVSDVEIISSLDVSEAIIPEIAIGDTISFTFSQVPAHLLPLQIKILGTAMNGIDYQAVDSVTLVNSPGETAKFVIQPIADSLTEQLETVIFNVCGTAAGTCFSKTFTLYIADPDSLYSPVDSVVFLPNGSVLLSVAPTSVSNKIWTFSNTVPKTISPTFSLVESEIQVDIPFNNLHDIFMLQSVCLNINHSWDDDLDIFLIAPNETIVELSTDNGAYGDNYTNTCFSPSALEEIRRGFPFAPASLAPFTGTFQPEGSWNDILGTPITGTWKLGVLDDQNNLTGTILDWSITFSTQDLGNFKYLWSTGELTPTILVNTPGTYTVTVSNQLGSFSKTFIVEESSVGTLAPGASKSVFQIIPNPSSGETALILNNNLNINALKVYDQSGTLVLEQETAGTIIGAGNLPPGVYILSLECQEGIFVQKLIRW
ncbi:MAG: choice-of-anchor L domain-containing protein [Saprospiraceae bacterium]